MLIAFASLAMERRGTMRMEQKDKSKGFGNFDAEWGKASTNSETSGILERWWEQEICLDQKNTNNNNNNNNFILETLKKRYFS
jgi:hypothetical protein